MSVTDQMGQPEPRLPLINQATAENTPKTCACYKSEHRDPWCQEEYPVICPWWEWQLSRHISGKFPPRLW